MGVLEILGSISIVIGCVFALTGALGVLRMPDFYSRLHPAGKSDTLGQWMILVGLALFAGQQLIGIVSAEQAGAWIGVANVIVKLLLLSSLLLLTAPTSAHAIAKAARLDRHTHLTVDGDLDRDSGASQIAEIAVPGDIKEPLEEEPGPELDVREDEDEDQDQDDNEDPEAEPAKPEEVLS